MKGQFFLLYLKGSASHVLTNAYSTVQYAGRSTLNRWSLNMKNLFLAFFPFFVAQRILKTNSPAMKGFLKAAKSHTIGFSFTHTLATSGFQKPCLDNTSCFE
jgi:hypothetical protein